MSKFCNTFRIESARLNSWDYSWPGWYYVTICTKGRECFFGDVVEGNTRLSPMGEIADICWRAVPEHFPGAELDEFKVMPNHFHGIIIINGESLRDVACNVSTGNTMSFISPKPGSLPTVIRSYKSAVSNECRAAGFREFAWQPRYFDHIIRNEADLHRIRQYIRNNALQWDVDRYNRGEP